MKKIGIFIYIASVLVGTLIVGVDMHYLVFVTGMWLMDAIYTVGTEIIKAIKELK